MSTSQIFKDTNCFTSIVRKILRNEIARFKINKRFDTFEMFNVKNVKRFVRVVTNSTNVKTKFYVKIVKEIDIEIFVNTIRKYFRRVNFRRCIACFKLLVN